MHPCTGDSYALRRGFIDSGSCVFAPGQLWFRSCSCCCCASRSLLVAPAWRALPQIGHVLSAGFRGDIIVTASRTALACTCVSSSGFVGEPVWVVLSGSWGAGTPHLPRHRALLRAADTVHPASAMTESGCFHVLPRGSLNFPIQL